MPKFPIAAEFYPATLCEADRELLREVSVGAISRPVNRVKSDAAQRLVALGFAKACGDTLFATDRTADVLYVAGLHAVIAGAA